MAVLILGPTFRSALLTAPHRYGHDQHDQHDRYGNHDYDDSCPNGHRHDHD
jgi:hypothetical protein